MDNTPYDVDDTRCDACGRDTARLSPPQAVELCDDCAAAEETTCFYCWEPTEDGADYHDACRINAQADNQEAR
jgi:hypothetical protein